MAARHLVKDTFEKSITYVHFLVCKGLSIDDVGVSRDTVFQEIRPGAGFATHRRFR